MVRAILEGRKTQTRRIVKYIPDLGEPKEWCFRADDIGDYKSYCPYGVPGYRLWVRENFWCGQELQYGLGVPRLFYMADQDGGPYIKNSHKWWGQPMRWGHHPSIHMPRWASRINLLIKSVRVERLQEITNEDAKAEGITVIGLDMVNHRHAFSKLWDSINGKLAPWDFNPYVWSLEFKIEK
jgi:hypothetical protein